MSRATLAPWATAQTRARFARKNIDCSFRPYKCFRMPSKSERELILQFAMTKSRGYCFTINNPTDQDIIDVSTSGYRYICYGNETGADGTPHLQGYIHFDHARHFDALKRLLPRAHIEVRRGTLDQAIDYCKKDGDFIELGEKPASRDEKRKRSDEEFKEIISMAEQGKLDWIKQHHPKQYLQHHTKLLALKEPDTPILDGSLQHEWWVGATGTGKSRTVWQLYPNHYQKELNKWWCGYTDEPVVVIEEWCPKNECTGSQLKIWADRYPFTGQIKGGSLKKIRPTKIIVLSNFTIDECFASEQDRDPIKRRFTVIRFPEDKELAKFRGAPYAVKDKPDEPVANEVQAQFEQCGCTEETLDFAFEDHAFEDKGLYEP